MILYVPRPDPVLRRCPSGADVKARGRPPFGEESPLSAVHPAQTPHGVSIRSAMNRMSSTGFFFI